MPKKDEDEMEVPVKRGDFYTLQEAYDLELLTQDDLKCIAYYQNRKSQDESFEAEKMWQKEDLKND